MTDRDLLIDVSRLIWRLWSDRLPTGVDRVCLAYVHHFAHRGLAVMQRGGRRYILTAKHSDQLFSMLQQQPARFRRQFVGLLARALGAARERPARSGLIYLNVGHIGLDEASLLRWIDRSGVRPVYLVHDVIPLRYPEYCRPGEQQKHAIRMEHVLRSASGLIANSQATLDDLGSFADGVGLPMPPSIAAWIAGSPLPPTKVTALASDRPYFVTVGTIEGRKNHALLLHIWQRLVARYGEATPLLFIVGQRGWEANHALAILDRATDLKAHVIELGRSSDDELASTIAGARALLMPSYAEGFGLPVAEALQIGTPVIASDLAVFREFAGNIPTYLDVLDGLGWMATIMAFTGDSVERERQIQAMESYRAPTWHSHFQTVDEWLKTIAYDRRRA
ncbi:MAG: glycosyltransferase family 4 protein [Sphingomonas sp.]|nr:glycosyltransferase family 4 protein [Sphingomonas sp.]